MTLQNKRFTYILLSIPILLLIPFVAMQFTEEVNWSLFDFLIMGALLLGVGSAIEFIFRTTKKKSHQIIFFLLVLLVFLLVWAELAVGIFGTLLAGD